MLDSFSWSLGLLIWKMGILLIAMPVHRNSRDEIERSPAHSWSSGRRGLGVQLGGGGGGSGARVPRGWVEASH